MNGMNTSYLTTGYLLASHSHKSTRVHSNDYIVFVFKFILSFFLVDMNEHFLA